MVERLYSHLQGVQAQTNNSATWVTARAIEREVHAVQERFVATQGAGGWGRPLYRTGLLHKLLKTPLVRVTIYQGDYQMRVSMARNSLGGRVNLQPKYEFFDEPELQRILRQRVVPRLSKRTRALTFFSRI